MKVGATKDRSYEANKDRSVFADSPEDFINNCFHLFALIEIKFEIGINVV